MGEFFVGCRREEEEGEEEESLLEDEGVVDTAKQKGHTIVLQPLKKRAKKTPFAGSAFFTNSVRGEGKKYKLGVGDRRTHNVFALSAEFECKKSAPCPEFVFCPFF